jgi:uncharacterized protein (DUF58 family)
MVVPTWRAFVLAAAGLVVILFTGSARLGGATGLLWLAAVGVATIVDSRFTPAARELIWERFHEPKLSLGAWNPVALRLTNRSSRPARFVVRDALPQLLLPRGEVQDGACSPRSSWNATFSVFPVHRGDYRFGPLTARFLGPLRLAYRQQSVTLDDPVKVYPNLLAVRRYDALLRRGHLQQMGLRRARKLGSGTEFERLRDYSPDDEFRRINWTATARRHTPITVEYQSERSQNVMLLLDTGRLMSTQVPYAGELDEPEIPGEARPEGPSTVVPALTRLDHAINAALMLAYVSVQHGDRAGLVAFSDRVLTFVKPGPGRRQFLLLTEALYNVQPQATEADYAEALAYIQSRSPRRSLAVIFTDIAHEAAATTLLFHIGHLARRHLPLVVTMRDPAVERLARGEIHDARALYERAVAQELLDQREVALSRLREHGALTLDVRADALTPSVINRYLEIKARGEL